MHRKYSTEPFPGVLSKDLLRKSPTASPLGRFMRIVRPTQLCSQTGKAMEYKYMQRWYNYFKFVSFIRLLGFIFVPRWQKYFDIIQKICLSTRARCTNIQKNNFIKHLHCILATWTTPL